MHMSIDGKERIGILGGTFNPVHIGHLVLALHAGERYELDRIIFMPCATPPHKSGTGLIEGRHRLAMIEAAIEWNPSLEVSDLELQRPGKSFAIETVGELTQLYPDAELTFIIGLDMLLDLHRWHRIYDLLPLCRFVTFGRPGAHVGELNGDDLHLEAPWPGRLLRDLVSERLLDVSSTDIRYRIAEGLSIRYLVPLEVEMYIAEHGLYQF